MTALRQKLPLAGLKSDFRFTPESRLNSEIAACPKSADCVEEVRELAIWDRDNATGAWVLDCA